MVDLAGHIFFLLVNNIIYYKIQYTFTLRVIYRFVFFLLSIIASYNLR